MQLSAALRAAFRQIEILFEFFEFFESNSLNCLPQGGTPPPARPITTAPREKRFLSLSIFAIAGTLIWAIVLGIVVLQVLGVTGVFWSLLGRSSRLLSPLDWLLGSLGLILGPPGALLGASWSVWQVVWRDFEGSLDSFREGFQKLANL